MYQGRVPNRATTPKGQELSNHLNRETFGHHIATHEKMMIIVGLQMF